MYKIVTRKIIIFEILKWKKCLYIKIESLKIFQSNFFINIIIKNTKLIIN